MKVSNALVLAQILLILGSIMFNPEITLENSLNPLLVDVPKNITDETGVQYSIDESEPLILNIGTRLYPNYTYHYDPINTIWGLDVLRNSLIYDSLVVYDAQSGETFPSLAKQWIVSEDSKHWIFHLRDDVYFHDGSKFNSSSVKFTYDRILDPSNPAYISSGIWDFYDRENFPLDSVEIISEYVVIINFLSSFAPFISEDFPIVSPTSFNVSGSLVQAIGTGPYMYDISSSNDSFHNFSRFSNHFRGLAPFEEVHFYNLNMEGSEFYEAFPEYGINFLPSALPEEIYSDEEWGVDKSSSSVQLLGYFNHLNTMLANQNVRKAINHAINRSYLINTLFNGAGTPMQSLIPSKSAFSDDFLEGFPYNLSYANSLLDEAGFIKGSDGYRFSVDLVGITTLTNCTRLLDIISENLNAIGIRTTIDLDYDYHRFYNGEYDIFIFGSSGIVEPSELRDYLHSESTFNTGRYNDSLLDELLVRGETTPIKQEREYYYSMVQSLIEFDASVLFLNFVEKEFALTKSLTNLVHLENSLQFVFNYTYSSGIQGLYKIREDSKVNGEVENSILFEYKDFSIPNYAVYFPDADTVLTPIGSTPGTVTVAMTYNLGNIILTGTDIGKFISIKVSNKDTEYYLRCYYDNDEIMNLSTIKELKLQKWNEKGESWENLKTINSNQTFRYIEVKVKGDIILRFREIIVTFQYLPFAIFFTLLTGGIVVLVVYWNFRNFKRLKGRFKL